MKGDRVRKSQMNDFWPKFYINDDGQPVITDAPSDIPEGAWVFQPRFGNIYGKREDLMVRTPSGSYVFEVTTAFITWGSTYIHFSDDYTYGD